MKLNIFEIRVILALLNTSKPITAYKIHKDWVPKLDNPSSPQFKYMDALKNLEKKHMVCGKPGKGYTLTDHFSFDWLFKRLNPETQEIVQLFKDT